MTPLRRRVFKIMETGAPGDTFSRVVDFGLIILIVLNVVAVVIESVPDIGASLRQVLDLFEVFSLGVFTVEYLLRIWSIIESDDVRFTDAMTGRLRYAMTPMAIIDLAVILPMYIGAMVGLDLRTLRILRLFRIFKLVRYSPTMSLLLDVLKDEAQAILAALFILVLLVVLSASMIYVAEHDAQPEHFSSIPASMWWAIITMTTVGYGDVVPITVMGKILGAVIGVIGIGMVALPAGFLAAGFGEALHQRKRKYRKLVEKVFRDGIVTDEERIALSVSRIELGLSEDEVAEILETGGRRGQGGGRADTCPHCGKALPHRRGADRN